MMINASTLLLIAGIGLNVSFTSPPKDPLNPKKSVIPTHFFKNNLSLRNAWIKTKYNFQKHRPRIVPLLSDTGVWQLTFEDDFDTLNLSKWRRGQAWGEFHPEHPHQYYSSDMIKTKDGLLYLGGQYKPKTFKSADSSISIPFAIGLINSDISFQQKYGYFEIRSKNPKGPATWPAFWLTGATKWPPEIDIFEMYGRKSGKNINNQYATIHYGKSGSHSRGFLSKKVNLPNNTDTAFHVYGCEWTPQAIKFFTDGRLIAFVKVNKRLRAWMDEPMVIILNNAFDEAYLQYLKPYEAVKNEFVVDWIRVYKRR
ncbi:MAG: glycoside hydrolase family 16 protein [Bacteroidetes bacterium]|nr:glycoside hydrolase family 16 protein [Bacteroidota bacterium]